LLASWILQLGVIGLSLEAQPWLQSSVLGFLLDSDAFQEVGEEFVMAQ
jgi:hypothetical protein